MADPPRALEKGLSLGIFETKDGAGRADDGEGSPVRTPVGCRDVLQDFPGGSARERRSSESTDAFPGPDGVAAKANGQLSRPRNREEIRTRNRKGEGLRASGPHRKERDGVSVPCRSEDDRLAVRGK